MVKQHGGARAGAGPETQDPEGEKRERRVMVNLTPTEHEALLALAVEQGIGLQELIRDALEAYIA